MEIPPIYSGKSHSITPAIPESTFLLFSTLKKPPENTALWNLIHRKTIPGRIPDPAIRIRSSSDGKQVMCEFIPDLSYRSVEINRRNCEFFPEVQVRNSTEEADGPGMHGRRSIPTPDPPKNRTAGRVTSAVPPEY
jgi:hypothetical protein